MTAMQLGFRDLFAACDRTIELLGRLMAPGDGAIDSGVRAELCPLLATLGDFADDRDIDDDVLCDVRVRLAEPAADPAFAAVVRAAVERVRQIKTAVHVEGSRRLREAMLGI